MIGSVIAVFAACAAATGRPFQAPTRGTTTRCPLHDDRQASLSLREDRGTFRCFAASCIASSKSAQLPGFGIVDVPIAFGIAADRGAASTWLSERNLIPAPDSGRASRAPATVAPKVFADPEVLPWGLRLDRLESHLLIFEFLGEIGLLRARHAVAELRAARGDDGGATIAMYAAIAEATDDFVRAGRVRSAPFVGYRADGKTFVPYMYDAVLPTPEIASEIVAAARALAPEAFAAAERRGASSSTRS